MLQNETARSRWLAVGAVAFLALGVFLLPYAAPVQPSISDSYVTGFNNRVAVAMFLVGGFLVVAATNGFISVPDARNRRLPRWSFWLVLGGTLAACVIWRHHRWPLLGPEASYGLERQFHLDHGQRLYRDFEYIYGPLLLYPGHWIKSAFHVSTLAGYLVSLGLQWVVGMGMLWFVLAKTDLPTRYRYLVLVFFYFLSLQTMFSDGVNYTPMRSFCAASLALAVFLVWRSRRNAWLTALCMALSMSIGVALSPEQGVSLIFGLSAYAVLLARYERAAFAPVVAGSILVWGILIAGWGFRAGEFLSTAASAAGGYNLPVLPSPVNVFVLGTYLCGLGLLYRALRGRDMNSVAVPLALCGIPMLSSALGRCDNGHLAGAIPLFVVSVFAVAGRPKLFKVWLPVACVLLLHLTPALRFFGKSAHLVQPVAIPAAATLVAAEPGGISAGPYFAPIAVPLGWDRQPKWSADSGYYLGLTDVILPRLIQAKADEITKRRAPRLILPDREGQPAIDLWSTENDLQQLRGLEGSFWVPHARNPLPGTAPIRDAIVRLYTPTSQAAGGWRVWVLR